MIAHADSRARPELSLARFWTPRYWPTWLLLGALHALARLPVTWQLALGRGFGRLLLPLNRRQRRVARRNLELCFPELSADERRTLLTRHFEAVGMSFVEMGIGWFTPIDRLLERVDIVGREHLDRALAAGNGALLFGAHFTTLEVGVAVLEALAPRVSCMYRPQRNAMMDVMIRRGRSRFAKEQIPRDNVRLLVRNLRDNFAVVYLPDQTYLGKQSELLPFFGEPAVTNTATSKLAKISGTTVLPYFFRRLPDGRYRVDIGPPLPGVPSDDALADTTQLFGALENYIRLAPEQYLWLYKKFKGRPAPYADVYANVSRD
ncbi:MAG TPA: lipid A biosynthesis acyltransferase [Gammaproteobacteria bacterium]|nr:lipid A biosynthesis acyltransferase [Gammaproteobacteria bacterium]